MKEPEKGYLVFRNPFKRIAILSLLLATFLSAAILSATENFTETRAKAERGDAAAQVNLGRIYYEGKGTAENLTEAYTWFHKAAQQGNSEAQDYLGRMYYSGQGVAANHSEAAKWWRKAAEQGYSDAQWQLGTSYDLGDGVTEDKKEAAKWFRKAADQGNADAMASLAGAYESGEGVTKDWPESFRWLRMAAERGVTSIRFNLALAYEDGAVVPKDEIEALAWFTLDAASGHELAIKRRNALERRVGQQATLIAQQRSKEILATIESNKRARVAARETSPSFPPVTSRDSPKSSGTGTIISVSGYVLTAAHVLVGASNISIITAQGPKAASVVRIDEANDLALAKIRGGSYAALPVGLSREVRLGQAVATIGFPNVGIQGFSPKLTRGEISSINGIADDPRAWQISVPMQPGNSGGPLLDENANVIGVVVAKLGLKAVKATGDLPQNVGYAVKSAYILPLVKPYLDSGAPRPNQASEKMRFEDMVEKAQQSVVLIVVY
jgi:TPR repeat protein